MGSKGANMAGAPGWWNGIHGGFKIRCSQGHEGSNPSSGTVVMSQDMADNLNPQLGSDRWSTMTAVMMRRAFDIPRAMNTRQGMAAVEMSCRYAFSESRLGYTRV